MATLQDKIKTYRGTGGVQTESSQEELQTLAGKAGLQAQPTDALSATAIGANEHQAKMAASPQVLKSSLNLSQMDPSQGLAAAARQAQARTETTVSEEAEKAKAEKLRNLGETGARVQTAIDAKIAALAGVSATQGVDDKAIAATGASDPLAVKADLQALLADPSNVQLQLKVNQSLGRNINSQLTTVEIQNLLQSQIDTIAKSADATISGNLTVGELATQPDFGYTMPDLSALLGVPEASLAGYSISELQNAVTQMQQQEFSRSNNLGQQAGSTTLGAAERATARDLGREASATGVRASEDDVARMQQSLANADQVTFGGNQHSVESLLGDSVVSDTITAYLGAPEGSPTRLQLEQTEPGLVAWIKQNENVLSDAAKQLAAGASALGDIQKQNAAVGTYGKTQLGPETLAALLPGYDATALQGGTLDTSSSPALSYLSGLPPERAQAAAETIQSLLTVDQQKELAQFSPQEIAAMELDKGNGSPVIQALLKSKAAYDQLQNTSAGDPDAVYSLLTGVPGTTADDLQRDLDQGRVASTLFGSKYSSALDLDKDGKLDDPATVLERMKSQTSSPSLESAASGKTSVYSTVGSSALDTSKYSPTQQTMLSGLGKAASDGVVTNKEFLSSPLAKDPDTLRSMLSEGLAKQLGPEVLATVQVKVKEANQKASYELVKKAAPIGDLTAQLQAAEKLGSSGAVSKLTALQGTVQQKIAELKTVQATAAKTLKGKYDPSIIANNLAALVAQEKTLASRIALNTKAADKEKAAEAEAARTAQQKIADAAQASRVAAEQDKRDRIDGTGKYAGMSIGERLG